MLTIASPFLESSTQTSQQIVRELAVTLVSDFCPLDCPLSIYGKSESPCRKQMGDLCFGISLFFA